MDKWEAMKREIRCAECAVRIFPMHPEDVAMGIKRRSVTIREAKKPAEHHIDVVSDIGTERTILSSLMCDLCGKPILDGTQAEAVTWWNTNREGEPDDWESEYRA